MSVIHPVCLLGCCGDKKMAKYKSDLDIRFVLALKGVVLDLSGILVHFSQQYFASWVKMSMCQCSTLCKTKCGVQCIF